MNNAKIVLLIILTLSAGCTSTIRQYDDKERLIRSIGQIYHHIYSSYIYEPDTALLFESALYRIAKDYPIYHEVIGTMINSHRPTTHAEKDFTSAIINTVEDLSGKSGDDHIRELLYNAVILGMIDTLDQYTKYYSQVESANLMVNKRYPSIGIDYSKIDSEPTALIVEVIKNSPAEKHGLKAGDRIVSIDGVTISSMSSIDIQEKLRGDEGSRVRLFINRNGYRGNIRIDVIRSSAYQNFQAIYRHLSPQLLYIRYKSFYKNSRELFINMMGRHIKLYGNNSIKGIIIDLRNNSGGTVNDIAPLLDLFVADQTLVKIVSRSKEFNMEYLASKEVYVPDIPLIVLVDYGTAGAAELLAQFLREQRSAISLGRETRHYGHIQGIALLDNKRLLKFSTGMMQTGSGWDIEDKGVHLDKCSRRKYAHCEKGLDLTINGPDRTLVQATEIIMQRMQEIPNSAVR